jgi:hypothetical protein
LPRSGLGRGDGGQAVLTALELRGQAHAVWHVRAVGLLGQRQQFLDLGLELGFDRLGVPIGEGTVAAGVGVDLGAVEAHRAEAAELVLARDFQHLDEERFELLAETPPKTRQGVVVRMAVTGDVTKRQ